MSSPSQAQEKPHSPATGSAERTAILDAARQPAVNELGKPVQFVVKQIDVLDGWAFLHARMQSPGGQTIDYAGTRYAEADAHGHKSSSYAALLKRQGDAWNVVAYSVGPTDVAWIGWAQEYGAPAVLFEIQGE
jgi:hypothetical protein